VGRVLALLLASFPLVVELLGIAIFISILVIINSAMSTEPRPKRPKKP
jgi:hypothetical protein